MASDTTLRDIIFRITPDERADVQARASESAADILRKAAKAAGLEHLTEEYERSKADKP